MTGAPSFIEEARVTSVGTRMRADAEEMLHAGALEPEDFRVVMEELAPMSMMEEPAFYSESGGATTTADIVSRVEPNLSMSYRSEPPSKVRQLQAQVFARGNQGLEQRKQSFEPGVDHVVSARIGRSALDWIGVDVPFPEALLPANQRFHELDIHLLAPGLFDGVKTASVILGQTSESGVASFDVHVPETESRVSLSFSVWRGATHLQSAILEGPVAASDEDAGGAGLTFSTGDRSAVDLDRKDEPDIGFVRQAGQRYMKRRGASTLLDVPGVSKAVEKMREALYDGQKIVEQLGIELDDVDALPVLRKLVAQGEYVRRTLFGAETLDDVAVVDVTSNSSGDFFPVEFFYDYPLPDEDAGLCAAFKASEGTDCPDCEAPADRSKLCPSGFWALRKVIQRQIHAEGVANCVQPEVSEACDGLPRTRDIVFAASDIVNTRSEPDRVQKTVEKLRELSATVHVADSWKDWEKLVENNSPALLLAIPHKVSDATGFDALQIGADENLSMNRIRPTHVSSSSTPPGPLLFLLGCNTANPTIEFQDVIRETRCAGASVVIGTLTYALGPQAAPLATAFVDALWKAPPETTIGEVLPAVRASLLKANNPLALAIVAFGDADWKVG